MYINNNKIPVTYKMLILLQVKKQWNLGFSGKKYKLTCGIYTKKGRNRRNLHDDTTR